MNKNIRLDLYFREKSDELKNYVKYKCIGTFMKMSVNYNKLLFIKNIPYFGPIMCANQGNPRRHWYMQQLVKEECTKETKDYFSILEIGSWAGGSAITWAGAVKKFNRGKGFILCVDSWIPYLAHNRGKIYEKMEEALKSGDILSLFLHNIKITRNENIIRFIRAKSDDILTKLAPEQFDLIFIDGSHSYAQVLRDFNNTMPLIRDGGILCGDDLEQQLPFVNNEHLEKNLEKDYIYDSRTDCWYHPGVTKAVGKFFKSDVTNWEGFWAMRKKKKGGKTKWMKIDYIFNKRYVKVPAHLTWR